MDFNILLVQVITLLYRESQLDNRTSNSAELANAVVSTIKLPDTTVEMDRSRDTLVSLRSTALWMIGNPPTQDYDRGMLLQRIRVNVGDDEYLYQAVEMATQDLPDSGAIKKAVLEYRMSLNSYVNLATVEEILKSNYHKLAFHRGAITKDFVGEILGALEPYQAGTGASVNPAIVGEADLDDMEKVLSLLEQSRDELSTEGILRTGWQAINRMFGDQDGARRGEQILVGALQHNYKTGFTLNLFKHFCIYNVPYLRDPAKKPLGIHISAENNLNDNIMQLYVSLKENETKEPVVLREVDIEYASKYVRDKLQETGYSIRMLRVDPSLFTYRDYMDLITRYESEGYEVHFCIFDYLNMINKKGCQQGPHGFETRDLFRRMRNFNAPRGITFITPHQLSTQAKELVRSNIENFVQEIANKGYYDSCRTIDQEVDMEISIHIEKMNGKSYLTCQRGKHRKLGTTANEHLYTVLKFEPVGGGIPDDINGPDSSCRAVGGSSVGSGDQVDTWWAS